MPTVVPRSPGPDDRRWPSGAWSAQKRMQRARRVLARSPHMGEGTPHPLQEGS